MSDGVCRGDEGGESEKNMVPLLKQDRAVGKKRGEMEGGERGRRWREGGDGGVEG